MSTTNNRELEELEGLSHHELAALALAGSRRITHLESTLAEKYAEIERLKGILKDGATDMFRELKYANESLIEELTALREKHRWISIAERLPEVEKHCLIRYKGLNAIRYEAVWLMDTTHWTDSYGKVYPVQPTDEWCYITPPDTSQPIENQGIWSYNLAKKVKGV